MLQLLFFSNDNRAVDQARRRIFWATRSRQRVENVELPPPTHPRARSDHEHGVDDHSYAHHRLAEAREEGQLRRREESDDASADCIWLPYAHDERRGRREDANEAAEHIKGLLQNARQQAVDGYTRLINSLNQENGIAHRIHKTPSGPCFTLQTTYLCLQCPNVSTSRERHHKNHGFCEYTLER